MPAKPRQNKTNPQNLDIISNGARALFKIIQDALEQDGKELKHRIVDIHMRFERPRVFQNSQDKDPGIVHVQLELEGAPSKKYVFTFDELQKKAELKETFSGLDLANEGSKDTTVLATKNSQTGETDIKVVGIQDADGTEDNKTSS